VLKAGSPSVAVACPSYEPCLVVRPHDSGEAEQVLHLDGLPDPSMREQIRERVAGYASVKVIALLSTREVTAVEGRVLAVPDTLPASARRLLPGCIGYLSPLALISLTPLPSWQALATQLLAFFTPDNEVRAGFCFRFFTESFLKPYRCDCLALC
jgi:hypothetical protein